MRKMIKGKRGSHLFIIEINMMIEEEKEIQMIKKIINIAIVRPQLTLQLNIYSILNMNGKAGK